MMGGDNDSYSSGDERLGSDEWHERVKRDMESRRSAQSALPAPPSHLDDDDARMTEAQPPAQRLALVRDAGNESDDSSVLPEVFGHSPAANEIGRILLEYSREAPDASRLRILEPDREGPPRTRPRLESEGSGDDKPAEVVGFSDFVDWQCVDHGNELTNKADLVEAMRKAGWRIDRGAITRQGRHDMYYPPDDLPGSKSSYTHKELVQVAESYFPAFVRLGLPPSEPALSPTLFRRLFITEAESCVRKALPLTEQVSDRFCVPTVEYMSKRFFRAAAGALAAREDELREEGIKDAKVTLVGGSELRACPLRFSAERLTSFRVELFRYLVETDPHGVAQLQPALVEAALGNDLQLAFIPRTLLLTLLTVATGARPQAIIPPDQIPEDVSVYTTSKGPRSFGVAVPPDELVEELKHVIEMYLGKQYLRLTPQELDDRTLIVNEAKIHGTTGGMNQKGTCIARAVIVDEEVLDHCGGLGAVAGVLTQALETLVECNLELEGVATLNTEATEFFIRNVCPTLLDRQRVVSSGVGGSNVWNPLSIIRSAFAQEQLHKLAYYELVYENIDFAANIIYYFTLHHYVEAQGKRTLNPCPDYRKPLPENFDIKKHWPQIYGYAGYLEWDELWRMTKTRHLQSHNREQYTIRIGRRKLDYMITRVVSEEVLAAELP